jgi:hypothetical protein
MAIQTDHLVQASTLPDNPTKEEIVAFMRRMDATIGGLVAAWRALSQHVGAMLQNQCPPTCPYRQQE